MNQDCTIDEEYRTVTKGNRFPVRVKLKLAKAYDKPIANTYITLI